MLWTMAMGFTSHKVLNLSANLDTAVAALMVKSDFQMTFGRPIFTYNT